MSIQVSVYDKDVIAQLKRGREAALDLSTPFRLIQESWWKGNRFIFAVTGPGKYADLKDSTKKTKKATYGFLYPILRASGAMEQTLIQPGDPANTISKTSMTVGTSVKYAKFLQDGTSKMVARPVVLLGTEQVAPNALNTRTQLWAKMIGDYINQSVGAT